MALFSFRDLRPFEGSCTSIKRPVEVTRFSFDEQHTCHPLSDESLRYYYPPFFDVPNTPRRPGVDLSSGFDTFRKYEDVNDLHLDGLLDTVQAHEAQVEAKVDADVITWRGMMTKILAAPYDEYGEFQMNATSYQGTIYIEENKEAKVLAENTNQRHKQAYSPEMMQYWGYKFETLSTLPRPWPECTRDEIDAREREVVSNHAQYCSIVRTGIGRHRLLIGGEVDGIKGTKPSNPTDPIPYVELKTSQNFSGDNIREAQKFERKMCRFWAQSFLLGVPTIIIGFRSRDGMLERLEEWQTLSIPNFVKQKGLRSWDGNVCINFAAAFLDFLRETVLEGSTWRVERRKGAREITLTRINDEVDADIVPVRFRYHRQSMRESTAAAEAC